MIGISRLPGLTGTVSPGGIMSAGERGGTMNVDKDKLRGDLRTWGRRALQEVWRRHLQGEEMPAEEARLAGILADHQEFADAWEPGAELEDKDILVGEVNPFLHVQIHLMVEGQVAGANPPEVSEVLDSLQKKGMSRHQAVHKVGKVLTLALHGSIREHRPFDSDAYVGALKKIRPEDVSRAESG